MAKCKRFEGKVAVITAATAGIGLGIAHRLGEEGAKLVICSRRQAGPLLLLGVAASDTALSSTRTHLVSSGAFCLMHAPKRGCSWARRLSAVRLCGVYALLKQAFRTKHDTFLAWADRLC